MENKKYAKCCLVGIGDKIRTIDMLGGNFYKDKDN